MALDTIPLPYGIRDIKLTAYTDASGDTLDTVSVDLPNGRTLSFSEAEDFEELRGDDKVVSTRGKGAQVNWDLEGGGLSFEAVAIMYGGAIAESGTTPSQVKKFTKKTTDARPWFQVEGQAISDSGGDVHCVLFKCRATGELSGEFADGAFFLTGASGVAIGATASGSEDVIYEFVQNETATAIA